MLPKVHVESLDKEPDLTDYGDAVVLDALGAVYAASGRANQALGPRRREGQPGQCHLEAPVVAWAKKPETSLEVS